MVLVFDDTRRRLGSVRGALLVSLSRKLVIDRWDTPCSWYVTISDMLLATPGGSRNKTSDQGQQLSAANERTADELDWGRYLCISSDNSMRRRDGMLRWYAAMVCYVVIHVCVSSSFLCTGDVSS